VLKSKTGSSHFFFEIMVLKIANMACLKIFFGHFLLKE
jgi:hypothetical protein